MADCKWFWRELESLLESLNQDMYSCLLKLLKKEKEKSSHKMKVLMCKQGGACDTLGLCFIRTLALFFNCRGSAFYSRRTDGVLHESEVLLNGISALAVAPT